MGSETTNTVPASTMTSCKVRAEPMKVPLENHGDTLQDIQRFHATSLPR